MVPGYRMHKRTKRGVTRRKNVVFDEGVKRASKKGTEDTVM